MPSKVNPYQQNMFNSEKTKGKNLDSLAYSRDKRAEIMRYFGGELPTSIMVHKKEKRETDLASGSYGKTGFQSDDPVLHKNFNVSWRGAQGGGLSIFPQNIGRMIIRLYTEPGMVVVDPFAGHNSRMELCVKEGLHYIGYDISKKFMEWNRGEAKNLKDEFPNIEITLHEADSRKMKFTSDQTGDFTITSPPYYCLEDYGDEPEQLGKLGTYANFIIAMAEVAKQNFRCLKSGAYCAWFVNDFRWKGKFISYHYDTITILTKAGFEMQDMVISDLGYPMRAAFAQELIRTKIIPKRHEYGIIVRKP